MSLSQNSVLFIGNGPVVNHFSSGLGGIKSLVLSNRSNIKNRFYNKRYEEFHSYQSDSEKFSHLIVSLRIEKIDLINQQKFLELLDKILKSNDRAKVIFLSSVAVYGESTEVQNELSNVNTPSQYGEKKIFLERYLENRINPNNLNVLRIANLFGLIEFDDVINRIVFAINKDEVFHAPDTDTYRDFVPISYLDMYLNQQLFSEDFIHGTYNFATGHSISLNDSIRFISTHFKKDLKIKRNSVRPEIIHSYIDNSKLRQVFDHAPTPFADALDIYLNSYDKHEWKQKL
jgi:nucleoside-diphosphate-sugar epimerase